MGKVIVMWSGGVESTSILEYILAYTTREVEAHHIVFHINESSGAKSWLQRQAVHNLHSSMNGIRPFNLTTSSVNVADGTVPVSDQDFCHIIGANLHLARNAPVLLGYALECFTSKQVMTAQGEFKLEPLADAAAIREKKLRVATAILGRERAEIAFPILDNYVWTKAEHTRQLGGRFSLTTSCARPRKTTRGIKDCGQCVSCKMRSSANIGTSLLPEIAALQQPGNGPALRAKQAAVLGQFSATARQAGAKLFTG